MASACSFHVGFRNATCYALEPKKAFWKMDGFVPVSPDPENGIGDIPVSVFIFGGKNTPLEDGICFINARVVTVTVVEDMPWITFTFTIRHVQAGLFLS
jgi:hypothetical protein